MQNQPSFNPNKLNQNPNTPGNTETINESFSRSVSNSHHIRAAATTIINTREDLANVLKNQHIELLTKATVFSRTGDFIESSYVVYTKFKNHREPLSAFLERYPQIKPFAQKINEDLRPHKNSLKI